jgi:gamma-glutamyltranspeptidase/glutathione hydrolase
MPRRLLVPLSALLCAGLQARQPERSRHAMVVSGDALATDVGVRVLQSGGNAVDAAVAVGFALAVTYPYAGNIGGGGFMLIRFADGRSTFIDFRERAPEKATRDMYLDRQGKPTRESVEGWRASGIPGTVRGFEFAHTKYGRAKWDTLLTPAIDLASKGFPAGFTFIEQLRAARNLPNDPESKRTFLRATEVGENFTQPDLARTLQRIAKSGAQDFYEGETAQLINDGMSKHGGLVTLSDLKNYVVSERVPLKGHYKSYEVIGAPPPSSGGIGLLQMLGMVEGSGYEKSGAGSAASIHYVVETMRRFFADRSQYLGDSDFVKVPVAGLLDPAYIRKRRESIDRDHATPSSQVLPGRPAGTEGAETTHFNVVDAEGNAVAVTYTLNDGFGSGVTVPGAGFLLNDTMDDFTVKPGSANLFGLLQGEVNTIQPGKRPLSAMAPTILTRDGNLFMVVGAPGGPRIISAVLQAILNVVDFGMNVQDAVDYPRFHHQWQPDRLVVERGISPDTIALLKARGHDVDEFAAGRVSSAVEAILNDGGWLQGASDGRRPGKAAGY